MAIDDAERRAAIFLSYARADRVRAERLAAALQAAGLTVWWDGLIEGGVSFADAIRRALDSADVVIVLWSRASIGSDWVRDEAAQGRDRRRLVPLSLDGTEPPLGFGQYHAVDMRRWRGRAEAPEIAAILRAVAAASGTAATVSGNESAALTRRHALRLGAGAAAVAVGGGALIAWHRGWLAGSASADDGIVVLPFRNLSGDPAQAYLSEGVTEEVRSALARNDSLRVLGGTSSNAARASDDDARAIARRLGVAYLLEGSVQRSADIVRISTELIDGTSGFSLWSEAIDRALTDIFAVQSEIAALVAGALSVEIATRDPAPGGTTSVPAYEAYLHGRELFNATRDEASDRAALAYFVQAVAADPGFALAHAGRARSLAAIAAEHARADELRTLYDAAIAAARRAIRIAPDLAEAHLALGYALFTGRIDVEGARPAYDRAYALGHGDADILLLFALFCVRAGRGPQARAAVQRALALDPINPRAYRAAGSIDYAMRRHAAAIAPLRRALALNPAISNAHGLIGNCLYHMSRAREARDAYAVEPHALFRLSGLAIADHRLGDRAAALASMRRLIADLGDSALYQQAQVLAQWGDHSAAIDALRRARAVGDSGLIYLTTDAMLDPLRRREDFRALLRALRLH